MRDEYLALDRQVVRDLAQKHGANDAGLVILIAVDAAVTGIVYGNVDDLAARYGLSARTLRTALRRLDDAGLIVWRPARGPGSGTIEVMADVNARPGGAKRPEPPEPRQDLPRNRDRTAARFTAEPRPNRDRTATEPRQDLTRLPGETRTDIEIGDIPPNPHADASTDDAANVCMTDEDLEAIRNPAIREIVARMTGTEPPPAFCASACPWCTGGQYEPSGQRCRARARVEELVP